MKATRPPFTQVKKDVSIVAILYPIIPISWNEFPQDRHGLGDLFVQGYYIPKSKSETKGAELGFGAAAILDTASHESLGTEKHSLGPAFILTHKTKKLTVGALANHGWSIAGGNDRDDASLAHLQPFVTRCLPQGWSCSFTSKTSYNWEGASVNQWTAPLGANVSQVLVFGKTPVSLGLSGSIAWSDPNTSTAGRHALQ